MDKDMIQIIGARENNLKGINLEIPKRKITIFTGVSGSGKSSVVFETIAQEAGRQLNETFSNFVRLFMPRYSQPDADSISNLSTAVVIDQKRLGGNSRSTLGTITDINSMLRLLYSRFSTPHIGYGNQFSFNDPAGMCPECEGIGKIITLDPEKVLEKNKSLNEGAILLPGYKPGSWLCNVYSDSGFFDPDKKIKDYTKEEYDKLVYAKAEKTTTAYMNTEMNSTYEGLAVKFIRQNIKTEKELTKAGLKKLEKFTTTCICPECEGKRYNTKTLSSKIMGYNIYEMTECQIDELIHILEKFDEPAAETLVKSITERLQNMIDIGLDYMNLNRESATLSGGEAQRVKMVKHLSSSLTDVLYIFDEPSIGLHPRDVHRLNKLLVKLRNKGNTVLVVEHDPDVIQIADHIIDMGPGAGKEGGRIVYSGTYEGLKEADTLTGIYMNKETDFCSSGRRPMNFFESRKSSLHNLKNVSLKIPEGLFTVVTGVAGSGKSTLVNEVFASDFEEAVQIDQNPVTANSRSNPCTYIGIMDQIRKAFAGANEVSAGLFSYNSEGACEKCNGTGIVELNLSFMDTVETVCDECQGKRFKEEVLQYKYKEKNIVEIMEMTVSEAYDFFTEKDIRKKMKNLMETGLHYITLGQPLSTLSGGECQRLKLAKELAKKGKIYILDEPTTGLHMSDIDHILEIIRRLIKKGNTVVVIEHNMEVVKNADWMIDLGPYGGNRGGEILFEGIPAEIKECRESITGRYI